MERLISFGCLQHNMFKFKTLETKIEPLLSIALHTISKEGGELNLYGKVNPVYKLEEEGIIKYWKAIDADGNPFTQWSSIPKEQFLEWLHERSHSVKKQVYTALKRYIKQENSSEHNEIKYSQPDHLLGY